MIIRKLARCSFCLLILLFFLNCSFVLADYEEVGRINVKIVNLTSVSRLCHQVSVLLQMAELPKEWDESAKANWQLGGGVDPTEIEDVDPSMTGGYPESLLGHHEREGPPLVNKSSTGDLLVDANHKIGSCPPAYSIAVGSCLETCYSDRECPNDWKCCPNDCGKHMCSAPIQSFGWYHWGEWGECSASCGGGVRVRSRNCNFPGRLIEQKKYCHGDHYELAACNTKRCPHYVSSWMQWSSWSSCSAKCGGGVNSRYRFRVCAEKESDENIFCDDFQLDLAECNYESCPDVVYSNWSGWSQCSRSCGTGLMARFRSCPFCPFTGYVGECSGPNYDYKSCTGPPCKDYGGVEEWSEWTRCTKDCDKGLRLAVRKNPDCQEGDEKCRKFAYKSQICNPQKCPAIAGDFGHWSTWSECSADGCEEGFQFSSRDCNHPQPWNGGRYCTGKPFELRVCNLCKMVNGEWSEWEPWTECSASCGGGIRSQRRRCDNPAPLYGGKYCPGEHFKLETCNTVTCVVKEGFEWGCWAPCSRKCGSGGRVRYALCNAKNQRHYNRVCGGDPYEDEACNEQPCEEAQERDSSQLSVWTPWSSCSHTCGAGTRTRFKYTECPGGEGTAVSDSCAGYDFKTEKCQTRPCPKKAVAWKHWSAWSPCSTQCGGGVAMRIRECASRGINQHLVCPGLSYDLQTCNTAPCDHYRHDYAAWGDWSMPTPCSGQCTEGGYHANVVRLFSCGSPDAIDCPRIDVRQVQCDYRSCYKENNFIYPEWSEWSACSRSCGGGYTYRNRTFSDDLPVNGEFCTKHPFQVALCNRESCDADGGWAEWSVWSTCTASCNGGMRARRRACTNPTRRGTGVYCHGDHFVSQQCNLQACVKREAEWSAWTKCSRPCGGGERVRFADCHDEEGCCEKPYTIEQCNSEPCEKEQSVSFKMLEWSEWSSCSKTCACGMRTRYRFPDCSGYHVDTKGGECSGFEMDVEKCGDGKCAKSPPIKENWGPWSDWGSCSVDCGGGIRQRVRECLTTDKPEACPGSSHGFDMCNTHVCPGVPLSRQMAGFGEWTEWTACSVESGHGNKERARFKLFSESRTHEPDMELEMAECTGSRPAVTSGGYSEWSSWSACTKTCGGGVQHRFRSVIGSLPCGDDCSDSLAETKSCGEKECIRFRDTPEFVGDWSAWSACSRTCGGGIQTRRRQCMIVSEPEYVFAPGKKVTEEVVAPPARPQPRSACLRGSTSSTSGIELGGCAIIFCPGELERFDSMYDNQVPQYQPYTPGYIYTTPPSYTPPGVVYPYITSPAYAYSTLVYSHGTPPYQYTTPAYESSTTSAWTYGTVAYSTYPTAPYVSTTGTYNATDYPLSKGRMKYNDSRVMEEHHDHYDVTTTTPAYTTTSSAPYSPPSPYSPSKTTTLPYVPPMYGNFSQGKQVYQPVPPHEYLSVYPPEQPYPPQHGPIYQPGQPEMVPGYQGWGNAVGLQTVQGSPYQFVNSTGHVEPGGPYQHQPPTMFVPWGPQPDLPGHPQYRNMSAPYTAFNVGPPMSGPDYGKADQQPIPLPGPAGYPPVPPQGWGVTPGPMYVTQPPYPGQVYGNQTRFGTQPLGIPLPIPVGPGTPGWGSTVIYTTPAPVYDTTRGAAPVSYSTTEAYKAAGQKSVYEIYTDVPEFSTTPRPYYPTTTPAGWTSPQPYKATTQGWNSSPVTPPYVATHAYGAPYLGQGLTQYSAVTPPQGWLPPVPTTATGWNGAAPMAPAPVGQPVPPAMAPPQGWSANALPGKPPLSNFTLDLDLSRGFQGGWSEWGPWSGCTESCDNRQRFKIRVCAISNGQSKCDGPDRLTETCKKQSCRGGMSCVKQCGNDRDCGSGSRCCTPDGCNSVCIAGPSCDFDPRAPCSMVSCRPGFTCVPFSEAECPYPPCEPVPKCVCPLTCPAGYRRDPVTGETLCLCNSGCETAHCAPFQRCVPLDKLCQSCPPAGLCLDEGCFLLQLYDKIMQHGINPASSLLLLPESLSAPQPSGPLIQPFDAALDRLLTHQSDEPGGFLSLRTVTARDWKPPSTKNRVLVSGQNQSQWMQTRIPPKPLPFARPLPAPPAANRTVAVIQPVPAVVYQGPPTVSPSEAEANKLYKESVEADYEDYDEVPARKVWRN